MRLKEMDANLIVVLDALLIDASVTKAASRLGRSPSAVSHALSNLREIFDDELFVRAGQKLVPTPKALDLAPTIHVITSGMESLLRPVKPFDPGAVSRRFVMACPDSYELMFADRLQDILKLSAPGMELEYRPLSTDTAIEELREGKIDFVITDDLFAQEARDIVQTALLRSGVKTLAHPGHAALKKKPTKKQFAKGPHIRTRYSDGVVRSFWAQLQAEGLNLKFGSTASSTFAAVLQALNGRGFLSLPEHLADIIVDKMQLAEIPSPVPGFLATVQIGWHRSQERDESHQWLSRQLIGLFQSEKQSG